MVVRNDDNRPGWGDGATLTRMLVASFLILVAVRPVPLRAQAIVHHVLVLNSYHQGLSWTDGIVEAIQSTLLDPKTNPVADTTELYIEYMDAKRMAFDDALEQQWHEYLATKYGGASLDLIIVSDDDAYNFLRAHRDALFPETPVIFCGVNSFQSEDLDGLEQFTGVVEQVDIRSTIDVALDLHPDTRHIYVVNDATATGQLVQQELEAVLPGFEDQVDFTIILDPSIEDLQVLRNLTDDSVVSLILLNRGGDGRFHTYEADIQLLSEMTNLPVYGLWDVYLGWGLVGGMLTSAELQGETAAEMAIQVLNGADIRRLAVVEQSPNRYMFDYEQLKRFDIRLSDLPDATTRIGAPSTVILNRPPPFLERYGMTVGGVLGSVVVALGAALLQRRNLLKKQAAEVMLKQLSEELVQARSSMEDRVQARTRDLENRSRQLQIASTVAREAAAIRDVEDLMRTVVDLISESFGFYHTGIFLLDDSQEHAVLRSASSEGGDRMIGRGHSLRVGREGIVGSVAQTGEPRIALDVAQDRAWLKTQELSETRSEMALPLQVQDRVIGVLDVQSKQPDAFGPDDIEVLSIVADQLGLAIENARLFEESQAAIRRFETAYGERMEATWAGVGERVYRYDGFEVQPAGNASRRTEQTEDDGRLVVPIVLRGHEIGSIVLMRDPSVSPWTDEERDLAEAISIQAGLSLENAQLLSESRSRARRERLIRQITGRIQQAPDVEGVLQTAVRELGRAFGTSRNIVQFRPSKADASDAGGNGDVDDGGK
ncbi:MAG: GAF domain-containing protein [Anaerolineae bacterium]